MENRICPIDGINDERVAVYIQYNEPQLLHFNEPKSGVFIAETPMVIERALRRGVKPLSLFVETGALQREELRDIIALSGDVPIYTAELSEINTTTVDGLLDPSGGMSRIDYDSYSAAQSVYTFSGTAGAWNGLWDGDKFIAAFKGPSNISSYAVSAPGISTTAYAGVSVASGSERCSGTWAVDGISGGTEATLTTYSGNSGPGGGGFNPGGGGPRW